MTKNVYGGKGSEEGFRESFKDLRLLKDKRGVRES